MKHPHPNDPPPLFAWLSEHGRSALPALAALSLDEKVRVQNFAALKTVFGRQNARLLPAQMSFGLTELLDYAMFEPHGCPHAYTAAVLLNLQYDIEHKRPSMDLALCRDAYTARIRATLPQDMQTALDGAFALAAVQGIL